MTAEGSEVPEPLTATFDKKSSRLISKIEVKAKVDDPKADLPAVEFKDVPVSNAPPVQQPVFTTTSMMEMSQ